MANNRDRHILEIDSVELSYGQSRVLNGVYLRMETGRVTAILGSNGSGKSSLMNVLCGAVRPAFKSMRIDGKYYDSFSYSDVCFLPQRGFIPDSLTPTRVLRDFGLDESGLVDCFPQFAELMTVKTGVMSGGEKRLLECYAVLRSHARFAMLDEPFSQVMPLYIDKLKELITDTKFNKGILLTDHMYRHVRDTADDIYVLACGYMHVVESDADLVKYGYINHL